MHLAALRAPTPRAPAPRTVIEPRERVAAVERERARVRGRRVVRVAEALQRGAQQHVAAGLWDHTFAKTVVTGGRVMLRTRRRGRRNAGRVPSRPF